MRAASAAKKIEGVAFWIAEMNIIAKSSYILIPNNEPRAFPKTRSIISFKMNLAA